MSASDPSANPATFQAALNSIWTDKQIADQLYNGNALLSRIRRLNNTKMGEYAKTAIHTERNWGFSVTPDAGGALNPADPQGYDQARWWYKHMHVQVKVQGSAIDEASGDPLSLASVIDEEISGAVRDLDFQITRMLCGYGNGIVAYPVAGAASATISLGTDTNAIVRGWLAKGAQITIGQPNAVGTPLTVTGVDEVANTITVTPATYAVQANDVISMKSSRGTGGVNLEMNSIADVVSANPLGGIDPANQPDWKSKVDSTSQALLLPMLYARNQVVQQKTGKPADFVITGLKQQRVAYEKIQATVGYINDTNSDKQANVGNVSGIRVNGVDLYALPEWRDENITFLTLSDLLICSNGDPYWQNKITGGDKLVWIQGEDAYGGKITTRMQLGAKRRNSHTALTKLT